MYRHIFYLKHATFRRLNSVSIFRWNLRSWTHIIELVPIFYSVLVLEFGLKRD
jgi:hypothetical protein